MMSLQIQEIVESHLNTAYCIITATVIINAGYLALLWASSPVEKSIGNLWGEVYVYVEVT